MIPISVPWWGWLIATAWFISGIALFFHELMVS